MCNWFARLWGDRRGGIAIEAAVLLPIFALALAGSMEVGRALSQAATIEKGLRAGAIYAAGHEAPLTVAVIAETKNIVRTLQPVGGTPVLSGWDSPEASVEVTTRSFALGADTLPVVRIVASVPYQPLVPALVAFAGFADTRITLSHEQVVVGQ